ncbi:hypothetical protein BC829DRAFT_447690 [Chytridium lagenaria]|nr:hypothetical protein BC829DRAFT_447690 [Chytridium lagenaria]
MTTPKQRYSKPFHCPKSDAKESLTRDLKRALDEAETLLGDICLVLESTGKKIWAHQAVLMSHLELRRYCDAIESTTIPPTVLIQETDALDLHKALLKAYTPSPALLESLASRHDFTITTNPPLHTHKFLLAVRIPYFTGLFTNTFIDSTTTSVSLPFDKDAITTLLHFLTTPTLPTLTPQNSPRVSVSLISCNSIRFEMNAVAYKLDLQGLMEDAAWVMAKHWTTFLTNKLSTDLPDTVNDMISRTVLSVITPSNLCTFLETHPVDELILTPHPNPLSTLITASLDKIKHICQTRLRDIWTTDARFRDDMMGVGPFLGRPVNRKIVEFAVEGVREGNVVEVLNVLDEMMEVLRESRKRCVRFLSKRWMNMVYSGRLNDVNDALLCEIAEDAVVDVKDVRKIILDQTRKPGKTMMKPSSAKGVPALSRNLTSPKSQRSRIPVGKSR